MFLVFGLRKTLYSIYDTQHWFTFSQHDMVTIVDKQRNDHHIESIDQRVVHRNPRHNCLCSLAYSPTSLSRSRSPNHPSLAIEPSRKTPIHHFPPLPHPLQQNGKPPFQSRNPKMQPEPNQSHQTICPPVERFLPVESTTATAECSRPVPQLRHSQSSPTWRNRIAAALFDSAARSVPVCALQCAGIGPRWHFGGVRNAIGSNAVPRVCVFCLMFNPCVRLNHHPKNPSENIIYMIHEEICLPA